MPEITTDATTVPGTNLRDEPIPIDFLYWEDCPSHERALQMLQEAIQQEGIRADLRLRRVETEEEAQKLRFPGSPTIRVDGADIDDNPALPIGLTCRVYRTAEGKMSPLPSRDQIVWALRQAARDPQIEESGATR